jgi:hypothetical protein
MYTVLKVVFIYSKSSHRMLPIIKLENPKSLNQGPLHFNNHKEKQKSNCVGQYTCLQWRSPEIQPYKQPKVCCNNYVGLHPPLSHQQLWQGELRPYRQGCCLLSFSTFLLPVLSAYHHQRASGWEKGGQKVPGIIRFISHFFTKVKI